MLANRNTDMPQITVVIPCFNYGRHLEQAVASVLAQTAGGWEVFIVDDGSTDDSVQIARALIEANPGAPLQLLELAHSGSPGATRNAGVAAGRGAYVVCLDADDHLDARYLAVCAAALDADPRAGIAYGDLHLFGDRIDEINCPPPWDARTELDCNFLGVSSMFRRVAFEQVGGFDTEIGYEDWDFWVGMIEHGWQGVRVAGARWHHRQHDRGVYAGHLERDAEIKARIALKHPRLYSDGQRRWAEAVLAGDRAAISAAVPGALPVAVSTSPRTVSVAQSELPIRSICLITKDYPPQVPGGIPRAVQMQAQRLAARGVEVHVITRAPGDQPSMRDDQGVVVHEVPEPTLGVPGPLAYLEIPVWSFVAAARFAELDATVRFDIVETPDYRGEALHLAPRPETALIVWLHSTMKVCWDCEPGYVMGPPDHAWHALEMAAMERADLLLGPSQLLIDTTRSYLGDRMRPVELMPYLFDADQFPVMRRPRTGGPIQVLFYGRLEARKNPELALLAVAAARARGLDVQLTMLGRDNGGYRARVLEPLQRQLGLEDATYLPHADVATLRAVLAETDVAILASRFDNSPLTIFEALSSGVPVITSDRVGTASWVSPEDGLLALDIADPAAFAQRAANAISDPQWMSSGTRAATRIRQDFAPEVVTDRLLDAYQRLLRERGRPPEPVSMSIECDPDPTRRVVVLAFADELVQAPELLAAYGSVVTAASNASLHIVLPDDADPAPLIAAVDAAGLSGDEAADLIAGPTAPVVVDMVLSRRAHGNFERIDEDQLDVLARAVAVPAAA
jgi:glycosyltransferase involved in cell wall biosynthesis